MLRLSPLRLEGLRQCVRPDLAQMPAEDLEQIVETSVPAEIAEGFMKQLGSLGKTVAPVLQRAAPGIIQGALKGAAVGGPLGAFVGASAGLAQRAGQPARPAAPAPARSPMTPAPAALPAGQSAAATLVGLLQNPAVHQALLSQVLGPSGNQQVPTATGANLPRGAINGLLMQLLANASEGLDDTESISDQAYLTGESGEYLIDPASPEQQAALVLSHLESAGATGPQSEGEILEVLEWMPEELDFAEADEWFESEESMEMVRFY